MPVLVARLPCFSIRPRLSLREAEAILGARLNRLGLAIEPSSTVNTAAES
jgi:hypothetical protein